MTRPSITQRAAILLGGSALLLTAAPAGAHPEGADTGVTHEHEQLQRPDASQELEHHDAVSSRVVSEGPSGKKTKDLAIAGRGERLVANATTDVWAHGRYAYVGTFNEPCGTGDGFVSGVGDVELLDDVERPGVPVFDVRNPNRPRYQGNLPSVEGSRINDVKVDTLNSGDVLVHSNEACAGGPGGFEIYGVDDPTSPEHLASVRIDELNETADALFGGLTDVGVHNLWLFTQGERDYVAAVSEGAFDNFRAYDITDPTAPELVGAWGAEELFDPGVGESDDVGRVLTAALDLINGGFGSSPNKFLHDITITDDGTRAYLSNWDAGLVLLDIADLANRDGLIDLEVISVALNPDEGSLDGEVNSHAAWPSEDGSIVVETEEDFSAWDALVPPGNLTFGEGDPAAPLPGSAIATVAGDDFEANQTGNTATLDESSLSVTAGPLDGNDYPAIELAGDQPRLADTGAITGEAVWIGRACSADPDAGRDEADPILNADAISDGGIAIVRRGACTFRDKNFNAAAAGADAVVIANNISENTPWGGVRIWDYSDPEDPQLASTFNTVCSASTEPGGTCDPAGTYSVHNVVVETRGNKVLAYLSWYWDGMLVLDVTDPANPVEVARFFDNSEEFLESNGGNPHDFWGVYKQPNKPVIYGSDRNGGLYIFRELGKGAASTP